MRSTRPVLMLSLCVALFLLLPTLNLAQATRQPSSAQSLITAPLDEGQLTRLKGNAHPLARPEFDRGAAASTLPMERMLLILKRSPEQEAALKELLDSQQDKSSPDYHHWLTPEQFGQQFGPADQDLQVVSAWLQSHGFKVNRVSNGRSVIEFSGAAGQVQEAFHTAIHKYVVNGEEHWANASDPKIPSALSAVVAGVSTLHNFYKKPHLHISSQKITAAYQPGKRPQTTFSGGQHALSPADFAVIYNLNPLYQAGVNGAGTTIAVVGRSNINIQDVLDFRNLFKLPFNIPNIVWDGPDPGDLGGGEEAEAVLDTSWSGAVAPNARVELVISASTNTTDGVDLSELFIIDNDLAEVMTESFGICEASVTAAEAAGMSALAEQAAAQGITYMVSTGDTGAAGCDDLNSSQPAQGPVSVSALASSPFVVAVGGTTFNEHGSDGTYWNSNNDSSTMASARSYIPENVWNESCTAAQCGAQNANILAGAGGASIFFNKPSWQSGVSGIPNDGRRDLPDVSLTAASHDPYLLCLAGSCKPDSNGMIFFYGIFGTSASAPSFAGMMSLVNQKTGSRQGQANYVLYRMAAQETFSQCNGSGILSAPASGCVFNDITVGNNAVPGEVEFGTTTARYQSGPGYDLASGLGSVNATNLVNNWSSITFNPTKTTLSVSPTTITHGSPVNVNITVAPTSSPGTPTGDVSLLANGGSISSREGVTLFTLSGGSASSTTSLLPGGSYQLIAHYAGDGSFAGSDSAPVQVFVGPEPSSTALSVLTMDAKRKFMPFTGGPYGSLVYLRADVKGKSGHGTPNGRLDFSDSGNGSGFGLIDGNPYYLNSAGNTATPNGLATLVPGQHSITAVYNGGDSFLGSSSPAASVTITKAATSATLTANSTSIGTGGAVSITATINTTSVGNSLGGTVTFFNGSTKLGTAPLSTAPASPTNFAGATATLQAPSLPVGQNSITAQYVGDSNYVGSTAPPIIINVGVDFSLADSSTAMNISSPGQSGTLSLTITGQADYKGTVTFTSASCAGLPLGASCSFTPAAVTGSGTTTLTVTTAAPQMAGLRLDHAPNGLGWWRLNGGFGFTLAGIFLAGLPRRRRAWKSLFGLIVVAILLAGIGCGGRSSSSLTSPTPTPGTPVGMSTVTVTATSGSLSHATTFTLNVQ
jgi:hypothetical protein